MMLSVACRYARVCVRVCSCAMLSVSVVLRVCRAAYVTSAFVTSACVCVSCR